jgi:hypothetical protein
MIRLLVLCTVTLATLGLNACGEKQQAATATKKADSKVWEASENAHVLPGWKGGDRASWEEQMRNRAQAQNDYAKTK